MQKDGQPSPDTPPEWEDQPDTIVIEADQEKEQLTEEQQKTAVCLDQLRRSQADFANYRRRMAQDLEQSRVVAQSALLSQLLPVLDDLGRALEATPPDLASHSWAQGLSLIARRLYALFDQLGIKQIGAVGELFNPRWHEAIMQEEKADVPEGTILQVIRPGYALGERIIRPAQVSVAGPQPSMSNTSA